MTQNTLNIDALWDKDAEVWVATSENVPGLVTEASTIESLRVFQKINDPKPVVASEAKQSQPLGLLHFARNDNWAFSFLEYSYAKTQRNDSRTPCSKSNCAF
ncbi:DUF1902 domain-containing protein [Nostoc sp.]|uniref:DUF1902 domain-containing protein n=1 Tax=Nostoc sp. TaxID=1180 RepID=UPI002FF57E2E